MLSRAIQVADAKTVAKFFEIKRPLLTLYEALAKINYENRQEWDLFIPSFTLFELVYGKKATLPIEQVILSYPTETINEENFETTLYQRTYQLMETLENNQRTIADNISHTQEQQKERHDKHLSEQPMEFKIEDQDGPFHIHEALRNRAYKLQLKDKILKKVAHGNRLKIYHVKQELLSSVPQLRTQISLIRPEDILQDLEPIIVIKIAEEGKTKVQLELNILFPTHHLKDNVREKIAFGYLVPELEEIKKALAYETELPKTGELPPAYWFYKIGEQLDLKIPYEDLSQKTFNKEAIQQQHTDYTSPFNIFKDLQKAILETTIEHYTNKVMITDTYTIAETLRIINIDIKYYVAQQFPQVQQPVESDLEEYKNESNNPITAQAKSTVNKKPRISQSRIVFNPPPETHWTKSLGEYGSLFGNLTPAAGQTEGNPSTWEQPPIQNLAESASLLIEETAILQLIGLSNKEKQPALAPREHLNMRTPIPLNITSNTPPINQIMAYRDIAKLEKFSGEEDNAYSWIADAEKAITANGWNNNCTVQALPFFLTRTANSWYQSLAEKPTSFTEFKLAFLQYFCDPNTLQDVVTLARDFEFAEQEANHTQAVNLAINGTSDIDTKITQLSEKLTQKIEGFLARTTRTYQPPQQRKNNNNSKYLQQQNHQQQQQSWRFDSHNCYYCQKPGHIAHDCRKKIIDQNQGNPYQQPRYQQNMVPQYSIPQNQPPLYAQQVPYIQPPSQNYYQLPPMTQAIPYYQTFPYSLSRSRAIDYNQGWRNLNNNQVQTNSGLFRPIPCSSAQSRSTPTEYLNQASYLGVTDDYFCC
ncbi:hypothetical protein G9A89_006139 [Geosiphon pyriformis]|nr:hypothetical protein G9A89_006139 [Geosiphon pyriformis]